MISSVEWITFDFYGTLIDWETGIAAALARFLPPSINRAQLVARYIKLEAEVERERYRPYRDVLAITSTHLMQQMGYPLPQGAEGTLPNSLPDWPAFPEVPSTLRSLRAAGHCLAILSNVDRDLLAASVARLGVTPDLMITAEDCHSYKPAQGHWEHFQLVSRAGLDRTLHVAASLYHDIIPASQLGYRTVFINRHDEPLTGATPTWVLSDLSALTELVKHLDDR